MALTPNGHCQASADHVTVEVPSLIFRQLAARLANQPSTSYLPTCRASGHRPAREKKPNGGKDSQSKPTHEEN
ncbi:hypothetical protein C0Q70_06907 [Pomacea canaliculata]|uniref:Uncharacterized protein n=1 Tax=Pomacea canaliculata TaxID=400727 RepID=A0A2T7PDJ8_POMCA|nr:hypothetical protein C0Q70_06907 [Pomacea canaliculata]